MHILAKMTDNVFFFCSVSTNSLLEMLVIISFYFWLISGFGGALGF